MLAAYVNRLGSAEEICHGPLPDPVAGPGEVLVRMAATTVNHVDAFVRSGAYRTPLPLPFVVGRDLVGTVVTVGAGVSGFAVDDSVWTNSLGHDGRQGAAAELAVVPADRLYPLSSGVDPVTAAAVLHPAATAYLGLVTHGGLTAGETVVVVGAHGNVGQAAVTIASHLGAQVCAVTRERGAPENPDCVDLWLDAAGVNDVPAALAVLRRRGRMVLLAGLDTTATFPVGQLYTKDLTIHGFAISIATVTELADAATMINTLLASGGLQPGGVVTMPLSRTAEAHRMIESGQLHRQRVVLVPDHLAGDHDT